MNVMRSKLVKRILITLFVLPIILIGFLILVLYYKQSDVVQHFIKQANQDFTGKVVLKNSHISPFENFPYISIDLENLQIFETKDTSQKAIIDVNDVYLGFDIINLLRGKTDIKLIKLKNGFINLIQRQNGEFNIANAFKTEKSIEEESEELHLNLKSILIENIDITKVSESNKIKIETFVSQAKSKFKTSDDHLMVGLDSKMILNIIYDGDTTFLKHKNISINSQFDYLKKEQKMSLLPSKIDIENAFFDFEGNIDFKNDIDVNIKILGNKPNFDLFMAFAPEELAPTLKKYENEGKIFFDASIKGKVANGQQPKVDVNFGCEHAYFVNTLSNKKLDDLNFKAHFSNGENRNIESMEFSLMDFSSKPEAGVFRGYLKVKNFKSPEIDTKIISDFDLEFLSKFLEIKDLQDLKGKIKLTMNFRDIIDLNNPERAVERLNESYYTELKVTNLGFKSSAFHLPVSNVNINAIMEGHQATIKQFDAKIGNSDISIKGSISDLPAIIHHTKDPVSSLLEIKSKFFDINELTTTKTKKGVDEQIENFSLKFKFNSSAKAFTESPNLPVGEFFIDDLYAKFKHYPHILHDFHADLFIDSTDFRIIDFIGMIDKSDFHFSGKLNNYDLWFMEKPNGDTKIEFDLTSNMLQLHDVFSYKGENYVPEDYRHEEIKDFKLHGSTFLHFKEKFHSIDLDLDQFTALMKLHRFKFENFKGRFHYEDEHILAQNFSGKLGRSSFLIDMNYYLGKDEAIKKRDNHFGIISNHLDFDELFLFNPITADVPKTPNDHEKGFNVYELPFTDMTFDLDIKHLNYHRYLIHNIKGKLKTTTKHYLYIDTLSLEAAEGKIAMNGYFNGSNKDKIYLSPKVKLENINLDKLLFKFENFGQDHLVSENLHGKLSGVISGTIRMHRDLVPIVNESEIHLDMQVLNGKLENYAPLKSLSEFFNDKNVNKVLFDTLQNHIDINKGIMSFPMMTINSSLGYIDVSGKHDLNGLMDYNFKIPMKLVTKVAKNKLFGSSKSEETLTDQEDEIQYKDASKNTKYINLKMVGTSENYKISLGKK
jgi:hypothetical protein